MNDEDFLKDLRDMVDGAGAHASHRQELAGRCLHCSCGSRAQLTSTARDQIRERLKGSGGSLFKRWQVVLDPDTDDEFVSLTTNDEERADRSVARHLAEGKLAEKRSL